VSNSRKYIKENKKAYYLKNREKILAYARKWREENAEKFKAKTAEYRDKNRVEIRKKVKSNYDKNKEQINKRGWITKKQRIKENPEIKIFQKS
jgi:biotin synthase-like enzyme